MEPWAEHAVLARIEGHARDVGHEAEPGAGGHLVLPRGARVVVAPHVAEIHHVGAQFVAAPLHEAGQRLAPRVGPEEIGEVVVGIGDGHGEALARPGQYPVALAKDDLEAVADGDRAGQAKRGADAVADKRGLGRGQPPAEGVEDADFRDQTGAGLAAGEDGADLQRSAFGQIDHGDGRVVDAARGGDLDALDPWSVRPGDVGLRPGRWPVPARRVPRLRQK